MVCDVNESPCHPGRPVYAAITTNGRTEHLCAVCFHTDMAEHHDPAAPHTPGITITWTIAAATAHGNGSLTLEGR